MQKIHDSNSNRVGLPRSLCPLSTRREMAKEEKAKEEKEKIQVMVPVSEIRKV